MKLRPLIKLPEYKNFTYKPVYYDKRKEALEEKIKKAKEKKDALEKGEYKPDFKGKFRSKYSRETTKKQRKAANIRFLLLVVFFSVLAYIIIEKSDVLYKIYNVFFSE